MSLSEILDRGLKCESLLIGDELRAQPSVRKLEADLAERWFHYNNGWDW